MTEISFYHLTTTPLENALPRLVQKAMESGFRIVIKTGDEVTLDKLNTALWTFDPNSFLPHGSRKDKHPEEQPIYLSDAYENPNGATLLVVTDGSSPKAFDGYSRVLDMFDGADEDAVTAARGRWKNYKERELQLSYLQQTAQGGWQKKA